MSGIDRIPPVGLAKELVKVDWAATNATKPVGREKNMVSKTESESSAPVSLFGF